MYVIQVTGQGALFLSQSNKTYLTMDNFFFMSEKVIAPLWKSNTVASRFGSCISWAKGFLLKYSSNLKFGLAAKLISPDSSAKGNPKKLTFAVKATGNKAKTSNV